MTCSPLQALYLLLFVSDSTLYSEKESECIVFVSAYADNSVSSKVPFLIFSLKIANSKLETLFDEFLASSPGSPLHR